MTVERVRRPARTGDDNSLGCASRTSMRSSRPGIAQVREAALRWLERYITEGRRDSRLRRVTASLAKRETLDH